MIIYHGSNHIIEHPVYQGGKETNDYGYGFYCTDNLELAKEWACANNQENGYANKYELNLENYKILNLTDSNYSLLNWLAILLQYRQFDISSDIAYEAKEYLLKYFLIDVTQYDIVIGNRADDSYFRIAKDFINNTISIQKLTEALRLGKLGNQIVLISERAHKELTYVDSISADCRIYYTRRVTRDRTARENYLKLRNDTLTSLYVRDIMNKGLKNGDKII